MRLFAAVTIDAAARARAARVLADLRATGADYKWVEPENLHLTLRFYGETEAARVPALKEELARAAARPAFDAELSCVGAFDRLSRPKVLWLGLSSGEAELAGLAAALGAEEGFKPHLTLGRQRGLKNLGALTRLLSSYEFPPIPLRVDALALIQSRLSGRGPTYETVAKMMLR